MPDAIEQLQKLGFSQYEAQAYIALLKESPVNGYELAKTSGIPRPNIYSVLQKLEERGAALRLTSPDGVRYSPIPIEELISKLENHYQETLEMTTQVLTEVAASPRVEYTLNLQGYPSLVDHARSLLEAAEKQLLLVVWPDEARELAGALQEAEGRGVRVTTLCLKGCPHPCSYCRGDIYRYPLTRPDPTRWITLVADQVDMLAGEIPPAGEALAVSTRQKMLVSLAAGYIQNTIALARILSGLGDRFDELLDPQTASDLNRLQETNRWFDNLRQLINTQENS